MAFGRAKSVLFIEVSSFQGVLIRGVPLYWISTNVSHSLNSNLCIQIALGNIDTRTDARNTANVSAGVFT